MNPSWLRRASFRSWISARRAIRPPWLCPKTTIREGGSLVSSSLDRPDQPAGALLQALAIVVFEAGDLLALRLEPGSEPLVARAQVAPAGHEQDQWPRGIELELAVARSAAGDQPANGNPGIAFTGPHHRDRDRGAPSREEEDPRRRHRRPAHPDHRLMQAANARSPARPPRRASFEAPRSRGSLGDGPRSGRATPPRRSSRSRPGSRRAASRPPPPSARAGPPRRRPPP